MVDLVSYTHGFLILGVHNTADKLWNEDHLEVYAYRRREVCGNAHTSIQHVPVMAA